MFIATESVSSPGWKNPPSFASEGGGAHAEKSLARADIALLKSKTKKHKDIQRVHWKPATADIKYVYNVYLYITIILHSMYIYSCVYTLFMHLFIYLIYLCKHRKICTYLHIFTSIYIYMFIQYGYVWHIQLVHSGLVASCSFTSFPL